MSKAVSKGNTFLLFKMDCIRVYLIGGGGGGGENSRGDFCIHFIPFITLLTK